jgi:hypothetical protein
MGVEHSDPTLTIVRHRNVLVAHWYEAPTLAQMLVLEARMRAGLSELPASRLSIVSTVHRGTPNFRADVREALVRITKDTSLPQLAAAHVLLVGGLPGVATRAFLSTATLLARPPAPARIFGDVESAARWLEGRLVPGGIAWTYDDLVKIIAAP